MLYLDDMLEPISTFKSNGAYHANSQLLITQGTDVAEGVGDSVKVAVGNKVGVAIAG